MCKCIQCWQNGAGHISVFQFTPKHNWAVFCCILICFDHRLSSIKKLQVRILANRASLMTLTVAVFITQNNSVKDYCVDTQTSWYFFLLSALSPTIFLWCLWIFQDVDAVLSDMDESFSNSSKLWLSDEIVDQEPGSLLWKGVGKKYSFSLILKWHQYFLGAVNNVPDLILNSVATMPC